MANKYMKYLNRIPSWLKNKYLLTGGFFIIWMIFFDQKDILSYFDRNTKLNNLENSQQHLKKQIAESKTQDVLLKTNIDGIEKYAREKFLMKKDNEDLFIIKSSPENK